MTFRELLALMQVFAADHPNHEALDRQVIVRVMDDADELHIGSLQSAAVDAGCTDSFTLVLDAESDPDEA